MTTLAITKFPNNEAPTFLYHNQFKVIFEKCSKDIVLDYEKSKVLIEFPMYDDPNIKIAKGLHAAVFMSKRNYNEISVYRPDYRTREYAKAIESVEEMRTIESVNYRSSSALRLTTGRDHIDDVNLLLQNLNEFEIEIIEVTKLGEFWAQIKEKKGELDKIQTLLNLRHKKLERLSKSNLRPNQLAVTIQYNKEASLFARVKLVKLEENFVKVFYIDYGNYEDKDYNLILDIYEELSNIPHQVIIQLLKWTFK